MDFDAGEGRGEDGWGGEPEAGPGELVVDPDRGEEVVGWLGGVAVFELGGEGDVSSRRRGDGEG